MLQSVLYTKQTEGENMAEIFVKMVQEEVDQVWSSEVKEMILTEEDKTNFEKAAECWICKKPFEDGEKKVRDHCHFSGKFRVTINATCFSENRNIFQLFFIMHLDMIHIYL